MENGTLKTIREDGGRGPFSVLSQPTSIFEPRKQFLTIEPCQITNCDLLSATVTGFTVMQSDMQVATETSVVALGKPQRVVNNGSASITQIYEAVKSVSQLAKVGMVASTGYITQWSVVEDVFVDFMEPVPLGAQDLVKYALISSYNLSKMPETMEQAHKISSNFCASHEITIGPCETYQVKSYVPMVRGLALKYVVNFEISLEHEGIKLGATETRSRLSKLGLNLANAMVTENGVLAVESGHMFVDFGLESVFEGKGESIPGCLKSTTTRGH